MIDINNIFIIQFVYLLYNYSIERIIPERGVKIFRISRLVSSVSKHINILPNRLVDSQAEKIRRDIKLRRQRFLEIS